jgi:Sensors of blue-light using FAD
MLLHRLLYRSDAALTGSDEDVEGQVHAIVEASRAANEASGLTGALLLSSGVFLQALEGSLNAVEATFERICGDLRHRRVRLLQLAAVEERLFGDWSMARVKPAAELAVLCPSLEAAETSRLDASTADAAILVMRTLLR